MAECTSGLLGGCAGVIVGHPLDTIKVKLQTQDYKNPKYKGTFDCFKKILRNDGARGLYRGMASPMMGIGGVNAILFGVQKSVNKRLSNPDSLRSHCISGVSAGLAQSVVCSPVELVKTRLQIQTEVAGPAKYKGPFDCMKQIYNQHGIRGVFKGQISTIYREVPAFATYFVTFEFAARKLGNCETSEQSSIFATLMAGGLAGSASWVVCYPTDVIKSRWQADGAFGPSRYTGLIDCLKTSVKEEGLVCLTRGINSTIIRAFPTNAATFCVVSTVMKYVHTDDNDSFEETCSNLAEILHVGDMIIKGGQIAQEVNMFQASAVRKLRENHLANYLPVVLESSAETINQSISQVCELFDTSNSLHFTGGEAHDVDTYRALTTLLYSAFKSSKTSNDSSNSQLATSNYWLNRRGLVAHSPEVSKKAMINKELLKP